ncbi:DUF4397 domain-containing protein [Haloarcula onubensis]|uniref:DUF4397 domain-containing protein n=1 Tax=Haloarcula onubensis TaxID=2950539 RepID=A0ABU2FPH3_9EURY|nr:DUF4397 domain-containing protein [Halomicroarcula sp. S3CR25-11]MDS0282658.1 DUF4397 domain-containing protein [Halomicroarcula sp. S3CR25-11]
MFSNATHERTVSRLLTLVLAAAVFGSLVVASAGVAAAQADQSDAEVRVVHAVPDAPAVDVYVDGELVFEDVAFGEESEYQSVPEGTQNVTVTPANDADTVVYEDEIDVDSGQATVAVGGELNDSGEDVVALALSDDADPADNESAVRLAHLAPDAPAVDVTVNETGAVLFDDVEFGNATEYETVPAGNYTLEVRNATDGDDGDVVATVDVTVEDGEAYTAVATGYLDTDDAPVDEPFAVEVYEDETAENETAE